MILTVPSWVIPGSYRENLEFLEDKTEISGVELLFFLYDDDVKAMLDEEWDTITRLSGRFRYTAHLPDPFLPQHEELVSRLLPWVAHFIIHPYKEDESIPRDAFLNRWFPPVPPPHSPPTPTGLHQGGESASTRFVFENTSPGRLESILPALPEDAPLCMDTGHLLLEGINPAEYYRRHKHRIAEIHLHGMDAAAAAQDGLLVDHRRLSPDMPWLEELSEDLKNYAGVLNIEVFSWEEASASIHALRALNIIM